MPAQTDTAASRIGALLEVQADSAVGMRLGMANDWGSPTGFSYTLNFATKVEPSDERIDLPNGAGALYIERKALWVGEGGLVGATLDIDEDFNLLVTPKEGKEG